MSTHSSRASRQSARGGNATHRVPPPAPMPPSRPWPPEESVVSGSSRHSSQRGSNLYSNRATVSGNTAVRLPQYRVVDVSSHADSDERYRSNFDTLYARNNALGYRRPLAGDQISVTSVSSRDSGSTRRRGSVGERYYPSTVQGVRDSSSLHRSVHQMQGHLEHQQARLNGLDSRLWEHESRSMVERRSTSQGERERYISPPGRGYIVRERYEENYQPQRVGYTGRPVLSSIREERMIVPRGQGEILFRDSRNWFSDDDDDDGYYRRRSRWS